MASHRVGRGRVVGAAALWLLLGVAGVVFAAPGSTTPGSLLVDSAWLAGKASSVLIVDYGRTAADYGQGHIPGAVFLDRAVAFDTVNGVQGELPAVDKVVSALEAAGIRSSGTVVVYDGSDGLWAARLFWALEYLGHADVRLLNGGLAKWKADGRAVDTARPAVATATFRAAVNPERLATKDWLSGNLNDPDVFVLDVRSRAEYVGEDVRAARGGHVPGSVNLDWQLNIQEGSGGLFLPDQELAEMYDSIGVADTGEHVTYCQTGVRAAHTYFVLRNLGYDNVRLYDGSWTEWGNDPAAPIVAGASAR